MDELAFLDATELLRRLHARELGAAELLDHWIARIERHDAKIGAVVTRDFERARERAADADARLAAGGARPPLLGLSMTVKDTFEVAGVRTTAGAPELAEHVPTRTATAPQRLVDAGANLIGKTNTPLYAGDGQTFNDLFGTTNNPFDLARSPGGSSGGSAAALAAGFTPVELGSDIGGSIRNPAHVCGLFGLKPTFGIVPERGHIPGPPGKLAATDLNVVGPLARSARDLTLLLDVIAGQETQGSPVGWQLDLPTPGFAGAGDLRVATWLDDPFSPVDGAYRALLEATVDDLEKAGAHVDRKARPEIGFAESFRVYEKLLVSVIGAGYPEPVHERFRQAAVDLDPADQGHLAQQIRGAVLSHREWLVCDERRAQLRAAWEGFFRDFDVLLMPVLPNVAIPHMQDPNFHARKLVVNGEERPYLDFLHWVHFASLCGLPASVAPIGRTGEGLPAGVQIVASPYADRTAIAAAEVVGELRGGFVPPPDFAD